MPPDMNKLEQSLVLAAGLCLAAAVRAAPVTVFAAASLSDALKQAAAKYETQSGDTIVFNFASSGTLARQIEEGAPADIFFSADEQRADALQAKGLLVTQSRRSLLGNALVLVVPEDVATIHSPGDLTHAAIRRIALGDVKTVPAGTYAKAWLEKAGLWEGLKPKVVPCENVRAVLAAVESGNVDAGVVYKTDAAISKEVKVVFEVPASEGPKISYPVALLKNAPSPDAARAFLNWLERGEADSIFTRCGFVVWPTGRN
jgi:molybdate transport system substrate-binding protein